MSLAARACGVPRQAMDAASANQDDSDNDTPPPLRDESDDESSDSDSDSDESDDESSDRDDEEPPPLLDESSDSDSDQSDDEDCSKMPTHLFCQFKECLRHFILEDGDDVNMPFCQYNSTTYTSLCRKRPRTGSVRRQLSRQRRRGGGDDGIWEAVMQTVLAHEHEIHDHRDHMQRRDDSKEQITSVWQYTRHNFKLHYGITRGQFARIAEVLVKLPRRFTVRHKDKKVGITREHALMILWLRWRGKKGCGTTWGHMGQHFNERGNFFPWTLIAEDTKKLRNCALPSMDGRNKFSVNRFSVHFFNLILGYVGLKISCLLPGHSPLIEIMIGSPDKNSRDANSIAIFHFSGLIVSFFGLRYRL